MQYTVPFCPQQNGVAERKNRYLMEMVRCMLFDAKLPNRFWGEAIANANYLQNRLPSRSIDVTPYEMWKNKKPNISHIQRFGCYAYAMIPESQRRKLDEKAVKLRFVGYDKHSKAYCLLNENSLRITISRDVKFLDVTEMSDIEISFQYTGDCQNDFHDSGMSENCDVESENIWYHEGQSESQKFERKSTRNNFGKPPQRYEADVVCEVGVQEEPKTYQEAVTGPDRMDWINAMNDELESIKSNGTWDKKELKEPLIGYADADWAEDSLDRKSNSGYIFKMNGGTISWASRKQTVVAISTAESEFVALTEASQEAMFEESFGRFG
ncbi:hypothetical protein JTB14_035564 [Gonioctena quinquepunctata]|nr:hypothetical protein JTB14_035564 [Gonioctena quinquepunctata]